MNDSRTSRFPLGASVRLDTLDRDPYAIFADLRGSEPVTWVPEIRMWLLTRHADVVRVLNDPETFTVDHPGSVIADMFGRHMMTIDGPEQVSHKRACMGLFKPSYLKRVVRATVQRNVVELLSGIGDGPVEFRSCVTRPLAVRTVADILGFPARDVDQIDMWYDAFAKALANFTGDDEVRANGKRAAFDFEARVRELLAKVEPSSDSLLGLLSQPDSGFSHQDIVSNALIIMFGGIETTDGMMSNALWALLSYPDQIQMLRDDPLLIRQAIDETLRWEPSVQSCTRSTTHDVIIDGVAIPQGETIQCMLGAANRDPAVFEHPDRFDIRRANARDHVSFGAGRHYCLGAPLAYLETETLLAHVLHRFGRVHLDRQRVAAPVGYEFRKPDTLWLQLDGTTTVE